MKMKSRAKRLFIVLILSIVGNVAQMHAAEEKQGPIDEHTQIKRRKLNDDQALTLAQCCSNCITARLNVSQLELRNYIIAQALLEATPLPTPLIDCVYDYAGYDLHSPVSISKTNNAKIHWVEVEVTQEISQLRLTTPGMRRTRWGYTPAIDVHIVPQEVAFDSSSLEQAYKIFTDAKVEPMPPIRSQCKTYCLEFSFGQIMVYSSSPRLSKSSGWKQALEKLNK